MQAASLFKKPKSTLWIRSVVKIMDHDTSGFLGSLHRSRLDKVLHDVAECCSSPGPTSVTVLGVKGQNSSKLRDLRTRQTQTAPWLIWGTIDLVEDVAEEELCKYFDPGQSTASEAQTKNVAEPDSLRVL